VIRHTVRDLVVRLHDDRPPLICGIVNVTPDSFSDGGRYHDPDDAVAYALRLVREGADMIDVGGESTRPGSRRPSEAEEIDRVVSVVTQIVTRTGRPVSVDTSRPGVMVAAAEAGAAMINDVRGLRAPGAVEAVSASGVAVSVAHMQGEPETMQDAPHYVDVVTDVSDYLLERAATCERAGVPSSAIVLDPGFGFGKTLEHNLELLANLGHIVASGYAVMAGLSRKSMLGAITGRPVDQRLSSSVAAALLAVQAGARIVRVHDVAATRDVLEVWGAARALRRLPPASAMR
jgi:dihydropteroate synthase